MQTPSLHCHKPQHPTGADVSACWDEGGLPIYRELSIISSSLGGLEPPSSRLTAERASLLRHRDTLVLIINEHTCQMSGSTFHMNQEKTGFDLQKCQVMFNFPQRESLFWNDCNFKQALASSSRFCFCNDI